MSLNGILLYVARALGFALVICAGYAIGRLVFLKAGGRRPDWKHELLGLLFIGYMAALVEIIALRGGPGTTRELRLVPLKTTLETLTIGAWSFIYNLVGNLIWFVPLGLFLSRKSRRRALLTGATVSAALECLQWLLMTGITDVDDILINALGALLGAAIGKRLQRK